MLRENYNTGTLLKEVMVCAASKKAEIEVFNLYKINYKGRIARVQCKRMGHLHCCAVKDDLTPIFERKKADRIIFASPIYFSDITVKICYFLEQLLYPYLLMLPP